MAVGSLLVSFVILGKLFKLLCPSFPKCKMEVVIVHPSQGLSGGFAMYVVCLSQYLAQHSFVVVVCLFLIEAVL